MKGVYFAAFMALLIATAVAADDSENLYDVSLKGTWSTPGSGSERFFRLEFAADTFTMHIKEGGTEMVESGVYQQDTRTIYLIITHGNKQTQKQLGYEVVDQYTIRVTYNGKKYMLERAE